MRFSKLGKKYIFNAQDVIVNSNNSVEIDAHILDIVSEVDRYVYDIEGVKPDSVYLRGSCLEESVDLALDIDIVMVYNERIVVKGNYGFVLSDSAWSYSDQLSELCSKIGIFPDVTLMCREEFIASEELRFISKKVYGSGENLSLTTLSLKSLDIEYGNVILLQSHRNINTIKKILYGDFIASRQVLERVVKGLIEDFYRDCAIGIMLRNRMYSRSMYDCHNTLLESIPYLSDKLDNVMDLFLNTDDYSYQDIKPMIHEMVYLSEEIQHLRYKEK